MLGCDATIMHGDVRTTNVGPCRVVLLFDVLHMLRPPEQEALLAAVSAALEPGGVALIREADASGGWRFAAVRFGNRVKALAFGHWRQPFDFRTTDEWLACFASHGLAGQVRPMSAGTPFANVLFQVTVPAHASAATRRPSRAVLTARPLRSKAPPTHSPHAMRAGPAGVLTVSTGSGLASPSRGGRQQNRRSDQSTWRTPLAAVTSPANASSCTWRKFRTAPSERESRTEGESGTMGHDEQKDRRPSGLDLPLRQRVRAAVEHQPLRSGCAHRASTIRVSTGS